LFATCEDKRYRDPKEALRLSKVAAYLSEEPHILDTLAESYYVNGDIDQAIIVARQALKLAKKDRSYFEGQLHKFLRSKNNRMDKLHQST
jgi:predicted Zn-dependent protease